MLENTRSLLIFSLEIVEKACQFKATINKQAGVSNNNETSFDSKPKPFKKTVVQKFARQLKCSNTFSFFASDFEVLFDNHWSQELKQGACYVFG